MTRTLTVAEAAQRLGITEKATRRRIERGTLPALLGHDGRRRIPVAALEEAMAPRSGSLEPRAGADAPVGNSSGALDVALLLGRLEILAAESGRLRALTDGYERRERELEEALHEARAQITQLQAKALGTGHRRWWRRPR